MKFLFIICLLISLPVCAFEQYKRKDYKFGVDGNNNCLNTRQEVLKARSEIPVLLNKKGCKVLAGRWNDYYFPQSFTDSKQVDIDHLIPLKHAHMSGAHAWGREQKRKFANDPENLVITSRKFNRQKGSKGIDAWLPVEISFACKYVQAWMNLKQKYQLSFSEKEEVTIQSLRPKCSL